MSNRIKRQEQIKSSFSDNAALIMGIFTLAVLCILPLVVHNYYFDILETKYQFYCACAIIMMLLLVGWGLASGQAGKYFNTFSLKKAIKSLNVVDWGMIAFWLCNVISWLLCSDWRWEAFWGTSGRFNGVFLMTIYMAVYFLITRFFRFRQWYLDAFLAVGIFVCIFGITDYFQMDVLGFKARMMEEQKAIYTSTFGNINTYTVYIGALLVVSMILFCMEKNQKRALWYLGNLVLTSFALVMGASDNAYLTLAVLFGLSPLYLFKTKKGLRRYLISLSVFATVIQCIDWINVAYADTVLGIDSAFKLIAGMSILPVIVIIIWLITGAVSVITLKKSKDSSNQENDQNGKWLIYAWIGVIVIVVAAVVFIFYDANFAGHAERYGSIQSYVVFNDSWGTERGYAWRRSIEIYNEKFTPSQKIFGYGPDTFGLLMRYYYDGLKMGDLPVIYDSAHNEYIHYLVTLGIAGLAAYLTFLIAAIVRLVRNVKDRPEVAAVLFTIVAYAVQATVNINLPIAMPIILNLLAMGLSRPVTRGEN